MAGAARNFKQYFAPHVIDVSGVFGVQNETPGEVTDPSTSFPVSGAPNEQDAEDGVLAQDDAIADAGVPQPQINEHAAAEDVAAAEKQISMDAFGSVTKFVYPFTQQVRQDVRALFPADKVIYDKADKAEGSVSRMYFVLRILTFSLFAGFSATTTAILSEFFTGESAIGFLPGAFFALGDGSEFLNAFLSVITLAVAFGVLRTMIRWMLLREIVQSAERFAHDVSQRYSDTTSRTFEMANGVIDRMTRDMTWAQSAELYAKAALYNAKRAEYLDRYSTNIAWKNRWMFLRLEAATFTLKLFLTLCLIALVALGFSPDGDISVMTPQKVAFIALLAVNMHFVWGYAFRQKGDFWSAAFSKETKLQGSVESNYYNTIPRIIANLVKAIQANERNSN